MKRWFIHRYHQYHCQIRYCVFHGYLQRRLRLQHTNPDNFLIYLHWSHIRQAYHRWGPTLSIVLLVPSPNTRLYTSAALPFRANKKRMIFKNPHSLSFFILTAHTDVKMPRRHIPLHFFLKFSALLSKF